MIVRFGDKSIRSMESADCDGQSEEMLLLEVLASLMRMSIPSGPVLLAPWLSAFPLVEISIPAQ